MSAVQFELSGGALSDQVIATATPTIYGWLAQWDTTSVPNGAYALQSVSTSSGFVGPVIAYIITKRICLGLQHKDNHLIEHGVETGIIRQLPGGEFIEETRPVDEDALAVLLSRSNYPPLPAGETAETDVPSRSMRGGLGRVRERTYYNVVTESSELPEPNGHAIGGGNGHAVEGNGHSHTAISSGATSTQADSHEGDEH